MKDLSEGSPSGAKEKRISLYPLKLKEALAALLATKPKPKGEDTQQKEQRESKPHGE